MNESEIDEINAGVKEIIESFGVTGARYIPPVAGDDIYGNMDRDFIADTDNTEIALSFVTELSEKQRIKNPNADALINILPDQELNDEDRIQINGTMYTILTIKPQNCFGALNHKVVWLAKHH